MSTDPRFAEPTPFARLVYAHAVSVAGDACLTVSLAGSLFFQSPTSAARGKVLLYLLLTMAPFAIVAPILGPAIDRTKGGRRLLVVASSAGRAVLCIFMAMYVSKPAPEGLLVYPLAFGALVLAKGHQVAKSSLVPALVKSDAELVNANSRLALLSVIAATVGGLPAAGIQELFGADWSLRVAAVVFAIGAVLALQIPKTRTAGPTDPHQARARAGGDPPAEHPARRAARWRCCAAASGSLRSSSPSRSRTTCSGSARRWSRARSAGSSA